MLGQSTSNPTVKSKRRRGSRAAGHHTVRDRLAAGELNPFKSAVHAKRLDGLERGCVSGWHRGNADVVGQDLLAEKGLALNRRTLATRRAAFIDRRGGLKHWQRRGSRRHQAVSCRSNSASVVAIGGADQGIRVPER
jgi:hypothetical protein